MAFKTKLSGGGGDKFAFQDELDKVKGGFKSRFKKKTPTLGIRQLLREMGFGFNKGGAVLKSRRKQTKYF